MLDILDLVVSLAGAAGVCLCLRRLRTPPMGDAETPVTDVPGDGDGDEKLREGIINVMSYSVEAKKEDEA